MKIDGRNILKKTIIMILTGYWIMMMFETMIVNMTTMIMIGIQLMKMILMIMVVGILGEKEMTLNQNGTVLKKTTESTIQIGIALCS